MLTTLGVSFGIALYVAIAIINHSTQNALKENIESIAGKAKLTITAGPSGFDESKLEIVKQVVGVKYAVAMIETRAFLEGATESSEGLYVFGVDLLQEQSVRTYKATDQRIIDDPLTFLNQPDSIIITKSLAQAKGLKIDSKINLATTHGVKSFTVRGLLEPEGAAKAYGGSLAIMDIDGARLMFGKNNKIDRIDIVPDEKVKIENLRDSLEKTLGPAFTVITPESQSEQMQSMLETYQVILTFFSTLALMVGLFLVMNSISVSVAERRREIGTLRALGATQNSMILLFISEVLGIGFLGSVLGCILGRFLAEKLVAEVVTSVSAQFQMQMQVKNLELTREQVVFSILLGTLASVFSALIPSFKAATIRPLEAMKKNDGTLSISDEKQSQFSTALGFILFIFMMVSMYFQWGKYWIGIDLITKASTVMGSALMGPFLVFFLIRGFKRITQGIQSIVVKLSLENILRSRKRTSSNITALMVGLFLVVMIATVRTSFHDTLTEWLDQIFVSDLLVTSSGRMIMADVQLSKEEVQDELLKIPGIRPIGNDRGARSRYIQYLFNGKKMVIKASDHYADFYRYQNFMFKTGTSESIGPKLFEGDEPVMFVTRGFLDQLKVKIGDRVPLSTPKGLVEFKILAEVTDYASPSGVIYMDRKYYKKFWNDSLVTAFVFNVEKGFTLEQVRAEIDRSLGKKWNLVSVSNAEFKQQMQQTIEQTFAYTKAIEYIALLVGLLGLLNTLLISVMERTRELGMLRAVGMTGRQLYSMIMLEAVFQGFFGSIVAMVLGVFVGKLFVEYGLTTSLGWIINFHFPYHSLLSIVITGVGVAVIAGILPSSRAAKINITEALDYE